MKRYLFLVVVLVVAVLLSSCKYTPRASIYPTVWKTNNINIYVPYGYEFDTLQPFKIELEDEPMIKIYLRKVDKGV